MVGYLYPLPERQRRLAERLWGWLPPRPAELRLHGMPLLGVGLPPEKRLRGLDRGAKALRKRGCVRVLTDPSLECWPLADILRRNGLASVDPLPLCRAKAPELALALVERLPLRRRCVALRGENAREARLVAEVLCPQVGTLLLDFRRGEEELSRRLREVYGAAALHLGQGVPPQVSVEFSPRENEAGKTLRLWGLPQLAGCRLAGAGEEDLPLLTLMWETGRLRLENITVQWGE